MQRKPFRRHDWLWLARDWHRSLAAPLARQDIEAAEGWISAERPLVVGRRQPGDSEDSLRLGLALPGKRRIGVQVRGSAVLTHRAPPSLTEVPSAAPACWHAILAELAVELERLGEEARVFGSLAWQYFARSPELEYVTADSDIDLLFRPTSWDSLLRLAGALQDFQQRHPVPRLDGEILLPDDDAVAWREVANRPAKVLSKGMNGIRLLDLAAIRRLFEEIMV